VVIWEASVNLSEVVEGEDDDGRGEVQVDDNVCNVAFE
jgi:hypothetical protein